MCARLSVPSVAVLELLKWKAKGRVASGFVLRFD
jgi:hypothetical protein